MVISGGRRVAVRSWTHWVLKSYVDQGTFQDVVANMYSVSLLATFSNFNYFLLCYPNLILSCTHEHFHLAEGVSIEVANIFFDKAARKVIKVRHQTHLPCLYRLVLFTGAETFVVLLTYAASRGTCMKGK
jgi:hypothetical protein